MALPAASFNATTPDRFFGEATPVLDLACELGEGPLWCANTQALYWVDIAGRAIHRLEWPSRVHRQWATSSDPACLARMADETLLVAMRDGLHRFDPATGQFTLLAAAPYDTKTQRFNDGRCDAAGRFFAGTVFEPRTHEGAAMYCFERGALREAWGPAQGWGVKTSNGLAFSPDTRIAYQADTSNHLVYRFDYDIATGAARNRRVFLTRPANKADADYQGRPDGAAVDAAGNYWSAQYEGGQVLCFAPDGVLLGRVRVAARRVTMCAFGGPHLRTLFITTAREGASDVERRRFPQSGKLFSIELDVTGREEVIYAVS